MLCGIIHGHSYFSLINRPTRVTENTSTIIDNFLTNCFVLTQSGTLSSDITDHFIIYTSFCNTYESENVIPVEFIHSSG